MEASGISSQNMKVFNSITDVVTKPDFTDSCYQFMDKHKDTFTDDEENKLEYTEIFDQYIKILQQSIDSHLF